MTVDIENDYIRWQHTYPNTLSAAYDNLVNSKGKESVDTLDDNDPRVLVFDNGEEGNTHSHVGGCGGQGKGCVRGGTGRRRFRQHNNPQENKPGTVDNNENDD